MEAMAKPHVVAIVVVVGLVGGGAFIVWVSHRSATKTTPQIVSPRDAGANTVKRPTDTEAPETKKRAQEIAPAAKADSPYKRCVRESIEASIADIRSDGQKPDYKAVEKTAIFTCEATMGCVGERECNAKARADKKNEKDVLERWQ